MKIREFIEKAIEGGWKSKRGEYQYAVPKAPYNVITFTEYYPFLDPLAWQAVGKVEGWEDTKLVKDEGEDAYYYRFPWKDAMHRMIDALAEGKTLEAYIETL